MTSYNPPVKGAELIFYVGLFAQSDDQLLANPTIAAGDFKVSKDGAAFANPATLPAVTPASGIGVKITLSTAEMNADNVFVYWKDASGDEWHSNSINIHTIASGQQFDDLSTFDDTTDTVDVGKLSGDATAADNAESFFDGTGYAGTNNVIPTVTALTGHTAQTGDNYARLGAPAGASVSADVAAIEAQTDDIGVAGAGLSAVPWNAAWDAEVQSEVADALNAYDPPTKAELDSGLAGLNDPTAASVADAVWDEALAGHVGAGSYGKAVADIETDATAILADTGELQTDWVNGGRLDLIVDAILADTNELQTDDIPGAIAALNDPTAAAITDAVWDETMADHVGAGSTGAALNAAGGAGDPWITALPGAYGAGSAGNIVGNLNDPTAAVIADAVWDEAATGHTDAGKAGQQLWTDVDAILADTNELQTDDVPTLIAALPTAVENRTEMDSNSTQLTAIVADTNELQTDWTNGGRLDLLIDAILADTGELQTDWVNGGRLDLIVDAILADTNELQTDDIPALIAALNNLSEAEVNTQVDAAFTTIMADSVPADGTIPTREQAIYMITQFLTERAVSGTTVTVKKADGSTGLMTFTLDDGTSPTSITRAT